MAIVHSGLALVYKKLKDKSSTGQFGSGKFGPTTVCL